jgi:hypothetical protein
LRTLLFGEVPLVVFLVVPFFSISSVYG